MAISKTELAKLTPAEFAKLRQSMEELTKKKDKEFKQQARQEVDALLKKYGFEITDLYRLRSKGKEAEPEAKTRTVEVKYRSKDGKHEYAGIGQVAKWLKEAMDNGTNPDTFLVKDKKHSQAVLEYWNKQNKKK